MRARLEAHGASPSLARQAGGILQALAKLPLDVVRAEKAGRNARDGYATEHLEIASYELLRRVAQRAGDEETAQACVEILDQERAMAQFVEERWDLLAEQSLRMRTVVFAGERVHRDPEAIDRGTMKRVDLVLNRPEPWESEDDEETDKYRECAGQNRALEGREHECRNGVLRPAAGV